MLDFKEIEISDKKWITDLLKASDFMGCEYSFANNMAWRRLNNSLITRYKDFYITGSPYAENPYFTYPAGKGDVFEVIDVLKKYPYLHTVTVAGLHQDTFEYFIRKYGEQLHAIRFFKICLISDPHHAP